MYDVLIFKVKQRLEGVSSLPLWSAAEEENAFDLPSFSAYPLPYIRSVGEYLLTLPQQLEPLAVTQGEGEAEEGEESFLATEWVFQVRGERRFGRQYMVGFGWFRERLRCSGSSWSLWR